MHQADVINSHALIENQRKQLMLFSLSADLKSLVKRIAKSKLLLNLQVCKIKKFSLQIFKKAFLLRFEQQRIGK